MDGWDILAAVVRHLPAMRGRGRIGRAVGVRAHGQWDIRMRGNYQMTVPRSVAQARIPAFTGTYEEDLFVEALPHIRPGTTVLDIGACVGFWTLQLATRTAAGRIVAFEPVAANRAVLTENVLLNAVGDRVTVCPVGLGATRGQLPIAVEPGGVGNAWLGNGHELVDIVPLDGIPIDGECSFVKMDVEGYEPEVLAGAEMFIGTHRPVILGEFSVAMREHIGRPPFSLDPWLERHDYSAIVFRPSRRRMAPRDVTPLVSSKLGEGDVLLIPKEQGLP